MLIDLQLHSLYSDGYLTPTKVAKFIARQGVKTAALTDHNTVGGLDEFRRACQQYKIKPVTGLEIYVKLHSRRFNILWYNFDDADPELHGLLRDSQMRRRRKMRFMLNKLIGRGFKLNVNKVLDQYNHYVPINRVVDDLMSVNENLKKIKKKLGVQTPREREVIKEYFHNKDIGILRNSYIDMDIIMALRQKIGGQIILCHPAKHAGISPSFFQDMKNIGLDGVEKISPHHSYGAMMHIQYLARDLDFVETGGSDFHRFEGGNFPLQYAGQYFRVESRHLRQIEKIIGQ